MADVSIQPWSEEDLPLLQQLLGDPEMMEHLGGPETPEQILRRHRRYAARPEDGIDHMFKITWGLESVPVGNIGFWKKVWRDRAVYEMGWMVLPAYQGRGIATQAGALTIEQARRQHRFRFIHAFPSVSNPASNAICRRLGFTLLEECQFEYPPGHAMTVNDWC